jgi:hypothetical protein
MIRLNFILFIFCIVRRNSFLNKRYQFFIARVPEVFSWIYSVRVLCRWVFIVVLCFGLCVMLMGSLLYAFLYLLFHLGI